MIPDHDFLTVNQVLTILKEALEQQTPFSLVRVGDGENLILAQESVLQMKDVLKKRWAKQANKGRKGVTLPNLKLRDEMVQAIMKANIVGIPFWHNDPILAKQDLKRPLTESVFKYFNIQPQQICHTFINRVLAQEEEFWNLLRGKKILLVGKWGKRVKKILSKQPYELNITSSIYFSQYEQMEEKLDKITKLQENFDIALVSCGVNAVVLSQRIAECTGKIAIDFGKSLMLIVKRKAGLKYSSNRANRNMLP